MSTAHPTTAEPKPVRIPRRRSRDCDAAHDVYELDVWLVDSSPPIWRSIAVPSTMTLAALHGTIQALMAWEDYHMHQFATRGGRRLAPKEPGFAIDSMWSFLRDGGDMEKEDESQVTLRDVFEELEEILAYEYDFGDSWVHAVKLIRTHADASAFAQLPACLAGDRAGPPEDCGGIWRYQHWLQLLQNPDAAGEEEQETLQWMREAVGDPAAFDLETANRKLKGVGRAPVRRAGSRQPAATGRAGGGGSRRVKRRARKSR